MAIGANPACARVSVAPTMIIKRTWWILALLSEQGLGVRRIDSLVDLADLTLLGLGVTANTIGKNQFAHVECPHSHQLLFCLLTEIHFGQSNGNTPGVRSKIGLFVTDDTGLWGGHGTLDSFACTRCKSG